MPNQRLTIQEKQEIKLLQGKESAIKLAEKYDVSHTTIYTIWNTEMDKLLNFHSLNPTILVGIIEKMIPLFVQNRLSVKFSDKETEIMKVLVKEVMQ